MELKNVTNAIFKVYGVDFREDSKKIENHTLHYYVLEKVVILLSNGRA